MNTNTNNILRGESEFMRKNNKILNETKDILPGLIVSISISLISMGLSKLRV